MKEQQIGKKGMHSAVELLLLLLMIPLSSFLFCEGYSFLHFFDLLEAEMRVISVSIMPLCLVAFCLLQALCASLLSDLLIKGRGKVTAALLGILAVGCGFSFLYLFCDRILPGPALLCLSFLPGGLLMARSYGKKEKKTVTILKASFASVLLLVLALLLSALTFEGGFAPFFEGLISRIQNSFELLCDDMMKELVLFAGGEEQLVRMLSSGKIPAEEGDSAAVSAFLENYREDLFNALSSLLLLIPSLLFLVYTISYYCGYGVLRLLRILAGDKERRPLTLSIFAAGAFFVGVLVYTFWSTFIGGGGALILLVINLIVMLTPALVVIGVRHVRTLLGQVFAQNKIMGLLCVAVILFSPLMVLALSGCYGIFGEYMRSYFEKKRSEDR